MLKDSVQAKLIGLILFASIVRLILGFSLELGNDEVYYWTYSQHLQWNYFDHPPGIGILIRLFTANLRLDAYEGFIRLGSVVCSAFSTYFIFRLTSEISSPKAGLWAAFLYTASIYSGIIAGLMAMPDSPQMLFWTLSLWLLVKIFKQKDSWNYWLGFGVSSGLCIMSKVHGVFLWLGVGLYILSYQRSLLFSAKFYVSLMITILIISPIYLWNLQNHFITYHYHSERVEIKGFHLYPLFFFRELMGQILYNNPIIVGGTIGALFQFKTIYRQSAFPQILKLFNFIALPMAFLILGISLFRETLPHWTGPAYVSLIPFTAIYLENRIERKKISQTPKVVVASIALTLFFLALAAMLILFFPGNILPPGPKNLPNQGEGDISLDLSGWRSAGKEFSRLIQNTVQQQRISYTPALIIQKWFPGGHLAYYFAKDHHYPVIGLGTINDIHQFAWSNEIILEKFRNPGKTFRMDTAITVVPSNLFLDPKTAYSSYYSKIEKLGEIKSYRGNFFTGKKLTRIFYVFELSGWKGKIPLVP